MKFVYDPDLENINSMLVFNTAECKVTGGLDVFTTKPTMSDRKLQKTLDEQMKEQFEFGQYSNDAGSKSFSPQSTVPIMSPPDEHSAVSLGNRQRTTSFSNNNNNNSLPSKHNWGPQSLNSSHLSSSPFGNLESPASRKVFAYVISILNQSDPDHDFSSLHPVDFKREATSRPAVSNFNDILYGMGIHAPKQLWECLDKEIDLAECDCYSHTPSPSYLADEPGTMWAYMWFFFNKKKKRVAYLHLRAVRYHQRSPLMTAQDTYGRRRRGSNMMGSIQDDADMEEDYDLNEIEDDGSYYDDVVGDLELE